MKYIIVPKYHPFYQLPYCCVPATLQWILYRRGLDIMSQEIIGSELGLRLPKKGKNFFGASGIIYVLKEPKGGFGTQIEKEEYSIQKFFLKHEIPLSISTMKIFYSQEILRDFIVANIKDNNDIILRYNNKLLKRHDQKSYGHFSLIIALDTVSRKVTIGDPDLPHFKQASLEEIIFSISDKIDGIRRGIYIVKSKTSKIKS